MKVKSFMKYLGIAFAMALVLIGISSVEKAKAAVPALTVSYDKETITSAATAKPLYYQVIKTATTTEVKANNWIEAASKTDGDDTTYAVDFSTFSSTKEAYVAFTEDPAKTKLDGDDKVVTIEAKLKSMKFTLNYVKEDITTLYNIFSNVTVKGIVEEDDLEKVGDSKTVDNYLTLQWKKGVNGEWNAAGSFKAYDLKLMQNSGATLYIRATEYDKAGADPAACRISKEVKIKIAKPAKAPTVKIDYVKGTVAIKNGMEISANGTSGWNTIKAYKSSASDTEAWAVTNDPTAITKTKISTLTPIDIKNKLSLEDTDLKVSFFVRTAATAKKYASKSVKVELLIPASFAAADIKEDVKFITDDQVKRVIMIDFTKLLTNTDYDKYEFLVVGPLTGSAGTLDLSKAKWTSVPDEEKAYKYTAVSTKYFDDKTEKSTTFENAVTIYIRKKAVKTTTSAVGVFASGYQDVEMAAGTTVITPAPEPESSPS